MTRVIAIGCLAAMALGCGPSGPRVPFRVITLGDDPFFATTATAIAVTVEHDGVRDPSTSTRFSPSERTLTLPPMTYGSGYAILVETELSGLVLARGRSFPFAVNSGGADRAPDVSLGVLGRYGAAVTGDTSDPYELATPSEDGALLASRLGLTRFVAHGSDGRPTLLPRSAWPPSRLGGSFVPLADAMLVVGGAETGASLVAADGTVLAEVAPTALAARDGSTLVAIDAASAIVIGGARPDGSPVTDVVRIMWDGSALTTTRLAPLPAGRTNARAVLLAAHVGAAIAARVLVYDGTSALGPASDVLVVDPAGLAAPSATSLAIPLANAAACALDTGLVLLAGGRDAMGVTGQVSILVVSPDQIPPVAALTPAPPHGLFRPREHAVALGLGSGIALVIGGVDDAGLPVPESEIAEVHLDSLPGSVVLTGSVPTPGLATTATRLRDHTVLVSSDGSLSIYFPPRGE